MRDALTWLALGLALALPIIAAALSPLLAWRDGIYIAAGFAGIIAFGLLLVQPLLAGGYLPRLTPGQRRRAHRGLGACLVIGVIVHVAGLWITSPPDVVDALLLASPTPFSVWGVVAMWVLFGLGLLALLRKRLKIRPKTWRRLHVSLALLVALSSILHALLVEGTMETVTKGMLCLMIAVAVLKVAFDIRLIPTRARKN